MIIKVTIYELESILVNKVLPVSRVGQLDMCIWTRRPYW